MHVAEKQKENRIYGTPALLAPYNYLYNVEKIAAADPEGVWEAGLAPVFFELQKGLMPSQIDRDSLTDEIDKLVHKFQRYASIAGLVANQLRPYNLRPQEHIYIQLMLISATSEPSIPIRMLVGSERGELSSSQDERKWADDCEARRAEHCEPGVLRQTIDRIVAAGAIAEPIDGKYVIDWPTLRNKDPKEEAETAKLHSEAMSNYINAGLDAYIPPHIYFAKMGYSVDEVKEIIEYIGEIERDDRDDES